MVCVAIEMNLVHKQRRQSGWKHMLTWNKHILYVYIYVIWCDENVCELALTLIAKFTIMMRTLNVWIHSKGINEEIGCVENSIVRQNAFIQFTKMISTQRCECGELRPEIGATLNDNTVFQLPYCRYIYISFPFWLTNWQHLWVIR